MVRDVGIYEADRDAKPNQDLESLIVAENLRLAARQEVVLAAEIEREMNLLRVQFGDEKSFAAALQSSALAIDTLRHEVTETIRGRAWIEKQIAAELSVTENECRQFFETNREAFAQPQRFRARHLFFAAHDGMPLELIEEKRSAIQACAERIAQGENVERLAAELSEDEATKKSGGDLGYFSGGRMSPEFVAQMETLQVGQVSVPFQSHLGFHIVQLMDSKPARSLSFDEVRPEIVDALANEKRATAVASVVARLAQAEVLRPQR